MLASRLLAFIVAMLVTATAFAQNATLTAGPTTQGHVPVYTLGGFGQPVVIDGGGSGGASPGVSVNPSELGITSISPTNSYPSANSGNGPNREHQCLFDAPITNPTGFHFLCFDPNAQGGGLIDYGFGGGATALPFQIEVNGALYQFPFSLAGIVGPNTSTVGDMACWNNTAGTLQKDCGAAAPMVPSLAALQSLPAGYANQVWRSGFLAFGDAPPLLYGWNAVCPGTPDNLAVYVTPGAGGTGCWSAAADPNIYYVANWGASPSANAVANAAGINAAQVYCSTVGCTLKYAPGAYTTNPITQQSLVYNDGSGKSATTLKLAAGQNTDLIYTLGAYSLFGTNSNAGVHDFGWKNITLDQNYNNQTNGSCLVVYGYRYQLEHVRMQNCRLYGWRSAYGPGGPSDGTESMEGDFHDIQIVKSGGHGVWFAGPHDSVFDNMTVVSASCAANNTSYGILNDTNGGGRFNGVHPWADSALCSNLPAYGLYDIGGGMEVTASQFEGAVSGAAYLAGTLSKFDPSSQFYSITGVGSSIVTIAGNNNTVMGSIIDNFAVAGQYGILLGGAGNIINAVVSAPAGAVFFNAGDSLNIINITATVTSALYAGAPATSDYINILAYKTGSSSNGFFQQLTPH